MYSRAIHTLLLCTKRLIPKTACSHLSCSFIQVVAHPLYLSCYMTFALKIIYRLQHYWMNAGNIHILCLKMGGSLDCIHILSDKLWEFCARIMVTIFMHYGSTILENG